MSLAPPHHDLPPPTFPPKARHPYEFLPVLYPTIFAKTPTGMSCPEYATGWYNDGFWTSGFDALSGELYGPYAPSQPLPPLLNPATRQYVVDVLYASDEALPIRPHRMEMPLQPLSPTNAQMNRSTGLLRSVVITDDSSDERNAKRRKIEKPKRKTVAEMRMEQAEKERASDAAAARAKTELLAPRRNKTRDAEIIVIEDEPTTSENKPADLPEVGQAQVPTYSPESPRVRIDSEKWYREYLMQQNERKRKAMLTANLSTLGHASPGTQLDPFAGSQYPQQGNQFIPSVAQAPLPGTYPSPIGLPQPGDPFYSSTLPPTPPLSSPAYNFAPPQQVQQWTADTMPPPTPVKKPQASQPRTEPVLCKEQADLVDLITSGKNVFYTGSAGCGKSTVLKAFTSKLKEAGKTVKIIAPTGRAALDINGSTFWTYAGWNPNNMKKPIEELEKGAMYHRFVHKRLNETDVLVIDEISMMENHHFERLNRIMKAARGNPRPFGGVQLIVTGDFCQLPPVKPFAHCIECGREMIKSFSPLSYKCMRHGVFKDTDKWSFRSRAWEECNFTHVELTEIHRQSDAVFIRILQKLRMGIAIEDKDRDLLLHHKSNTKTAVRLFPTLAEVKKVNDEAFSKLVAAPKSYTCLDHFSWNPAHRNLESKGLRNAYDNSLLALREHRLDPTISLKAGMLVVLLTNLDIGAGLVNGTQGRIVGFQPHNDADLPKPLSQLRERGTGRSRGDKDDPYLNPPVGSGQTLGGDYADFRAEQIKAFIHGCRVPEWPIVRFDTPSGPLKRTIYADCRVNELGDEQPYSLLSRTQIPLSAAWAMTVHKSQGMTLDKVVVNLSRAFEEGMEYVALSRVRGLEGLKVEGLADGGVGGANEEVRGFLREKFRSVEQVKGL